MEYGEYLAGECLTCHMATGATEKIPPIVGWGPPALIHALYDYKTGARRHPVMQMVAGSLGDEEIAALAAYLATIPPH